MYRHARNLEFEQAALLRDQLDQLRQLELDLAPSTDLRCCRAMPPTAGEAAKADLISCRAAGGGSGIFRRFQAHLRQARSSVVEHFLDMEVVGGSIPLAPTKPHFLAS